MVYKMAGESTPDDINRLFAAQNPRSRSPRYPINIIDVSKSQSGITYESQGAVGGRQPDVDDQQYESSYDGNSTQSSLSQSGHHANFTGSGSTQGSMVQSGHHSNIPGFSSTQNLMAQPGHHTNFSYGVPIVPVSSESNSSTSRNSLTQSGKHTNNQRSEGNIDQKQNNGDDIGHNNDSGHKDTNNPIQNQSNQPQTKSPTSRRDRKFPAFQPQQDQEHDAIFDENSETSQSDSGRSNATQNDVTVRKTSRRLRTFTDHSVTSNYERLDDSGSTCCCPCCVIL